MDYTFVFWIKSTRICAEKKTPKGIISDIPVNNIIEHFPLRLLGFLLAIMYSMQEMFSMEFEINQKFPFPIALQTFPYLGLHLNEHICRIFISIEIFKVGFMAHNKNVFNISKDDIRVSIKCMCISFLHRSKIVIVQSYLPFCFELFLFHSKTPKRSDNKLCKGYKIILIYINCRFKNNNIISELIPNVEVEQPVVALHWCSLQLHWLSQSTP